MMAMKTIRQRSPVRIITAANREIAFGVDKLRVLLGDPSHGRDIHLRFAKSLVALEKGRERGLVKSLASYRYPEAKDGKQVTDSPLKDGVHDHFCDSVRYFAVGRWLCDGRLRMQDPLLSKRSDPGWKIAA